MKTKNLYNLTKKELSYLKSIEEPVLSDYDGKPLTKPVVLAINPDTKNVVSIYTLKFYKHKVKQGFLSACFEYHLRVVF